VKNALGMWFKVECDSEQSINARRGPRCPVGGVMPSRRVRHQPALATVGAAGRFTSEIVFDGGIITVRPAPANAPPSRHWRRHVQDLGFRTTLGLHAPDLGWAT